MTKTSFLGIISKKIFFMKLTSKKKILIKNIFNKFFNILYLHDVAPNTVRTIHSNPIPQSIRCTKHVLYVEFLVKTPWIQVYGSNKNINLQDLSFSGKEILMHIWHVVLGVWIGLGQ